MTRIVSKPAPSDVVATEGRSTQVLQTYLDDVEQRLNNFLLGDAVRLAAYTVATVPTATNIGLIFVSDEVGGPALAYSDGTNWRRSTDGAIVS